MPGGNSIPKTESEGKGSARWVALALAISLAGCYDGPCRRADTYAYADLFVALPENGTLDRVLVEMGWNLTGSEVGARATFALADGRLAQLSRGTPRGEGLFVSEPASLVETPEESRSRLTPAVEPLAARLGAQVTYYGGVEHCGSV